MYHYTVSAKGDVKDIVLRIEDLLKEKGFGVLWSFNIKEKLNNKGLEWENDIINLEVCNPFEAKKVLDKNIFASYFLPCKITVLKDGNDIKIGMIKPSYLIQMIGDEELKEQAIEIENELIEVIQKLGE